MPLTMNAFAIPGYETPETVEMAGIVETNDQAAAATPYKIPPAVWIFVLGVVGYFIVRGMVED